MTRQRRSEVMIKRELLGSIMRGSNHWMYRALILSRRLELLGYSTDDVMKADRDQLVHLVKRELSTNDETEVLNG